LSVTLYVLQLVFIYGSLSSGVVLMVVLMSLWCHYYAVVLHRIDVSGIWHGVALPLAVLNGRLLTFHEWVT